MMIEAIIITAALVVDLMIILFCYKMKKDASEETNNVEKKMKRRDVCQKRLNIFDDIEHNSVDLMKWLTDIVSQTNLEIVNRDEIAAPNVQYVITWDRESNPEKMVKATVEVDASKINTLSVLLPVVALHLIYMNKLERENDPPREEFLREIWVMCGMLVYVFYGKHEWAWIYGHAVGEETDHMVMDAFEGKRNKFYAYLEAASKYAKEGTTNG